MTVTLATALFVQGVSLLLLRLRLGKGWLRRPVTILVLTSVIYQGASQVVLIAPSVARWDTYRLGIASQFTGQAALVMSAAMLALTVGYLITRPERACAVPSAADIRAAASVLDWRLLTAACLPLAVLTFAGRGYNSGGPATGAGAAPSASLASAFLVLLVVLAAFALLLRQGTRLFLLVLIAQSILLAAAGERTPILIAAIALAVLLASCGYRIPGRQALAAVVLTAVVVLALTGTRAVHGRDFYHQDTGFEARVKALGTGLSAAVSDRSGPGIAALAATRLDGTAFAAGVLQSVSMGQPRLRTIEVPESLLLAVPSAAWSAKASDNALSPVWEEIGSFGLQQTNYLPTLPGMYTGYLTDPWLDALLGLLGLLAGAGERWLLRAWTPARFVLLAGAVSAVLGYEQGLPGILVALRSAALIALAVKALEVARSRREARRPAVIPPSQQREKTRSDSRELGTSADIFR